MSARVPKQDVILIDAAAQREGTNRSTLIWLTVMVRVREILKLGAA